MQRHTGNESSFEQKFYQREPRAAIDFANQFAAGAVRTAIAESLNPRSVPCWYIVRSRIRDEAIAAYYYYYMLLTCSCT